MSFCLTYKLRFIPIQNDLITSRSYGAVFLAQHKVTGAYVAIKSLYTLGTKTDEIEQEINIMRDCDSDYIVRYLGRFIKDNYMWVCSALNTYKE